MMRGMVNQSCEAILPIVVRNNAKTQFMDAVIDTGFSGFLTLPSSFITALDLTWKGRDVATLGDGTSCIFEVYIADLIWDGQYRTIDINESETIPLIGMQLLRGYDLRIQTIEGWHCDDRSFELEQEQAIAHAQRASSSSAKEATSFVASCAAVARPDCKASSRRSPPHQSPQHHRAEPKLSVGSRQGCDTKA